MSVGSTLIFCNFDSIFFREKPQSINTFDSGVDRRTEFPRLPLPRCVISMLTISEVGAS